MSNTNTQIGLVAFFDILGYQNLLKRNEPETIAEQVLPILLGLKDAVLTKCVERITSPQTKDAAKPVISRMKWLSFSDTILLTLPIEGSANEVFDWMVFLFAVDVIQDELFTSGLPARGAIDYGKFYVHDDHNSSFAGQTIVNAYQLSEQIQMAACVLSNVSAKKIESYRNQQNNAELFVPFMSEYLVPLKGGSEQHMFVVDSLPYEANMGNVHQLVMRAFWGHKKDIEQAVRSKIINTEQWFESIILKRSKVTA